MIKFATIDMSWEEEGERGVPPQRALRASLMVLTEMLYNRRNWSFAKRFHGAPRVKSVASFSGSSLERLRGRKCNNPACDRKERAGLRPPVYTTGRGKV